MQYINKRTIVYIPRCIDSWEVIEIKNIFFLV